MTDQTEYEPNPYRSRMRKHGYYLLFEDGEPNEVVTALGDVDPENLVGALSRFLDALAARMKKTIGATATRGLPVSRARWWAAYPEAEDVDDLLMETLVRECPEIEEGDLGLNSFSRMEEGRDVVSALLEIARQAVLPIEERENPTVEHGGDHWILSVPAEGQRDPFDVALEHAAKRAGVPLEKGRTMPTAIDGPSEVRFASWNRWAWWEANRDRALASYLIDRLDRADGPLPYDEWLQPLELARSRPLMTALQEDGLIRVDEEGLVWRTHPER